MFSKPNKSSLVPTTHSTCWSTAVLPLPERNSSSWNSCTSVLVHHSTESYSVDSNLIPLVSQDKGRGWKSSELHDSCCSLQISCNNSKSHIPATKHTHTHIVNTCKCTSGAEWGSRTLRKVCYRAFPGSAMCVQNLDDSRGFAIRITYRISLRSSSLWEPRHPLLKVVRH